MKLSTIIAVCFATLLSGSCLDKKNKNSTLTDSLKITVRKISHARIAAEKNDELESFLKYYDETTICMPEYQPTLRGIGEIGDFYKEIFRRQNIRMLERTTEEIINLDSTVIEIGTFRKEYSAEGTDTILTQNGKYWNIWSIRSDGLKLKGEIFGFFHPVEHPERLTVQLSTKQTKQTALYSAQDIPLELRAYNALNEKYVRMRDGALRSGFYTDDARYMPFQEPTVTGIDQIKPYLIAYSSRGEISLDSLAVDTYHYEYFEDYVLEYSKFKVKWSTPNSSGRTEGKGARLWKRQEDKSIKIYRHIGTHNYIE